MEVDNPENTATESGDDRLVRTAKGYMPPFEKARSEAKRFVRPRTVLVVLAASV